MKDHSSPSPTGDPIVIRLNLHIHDLSGKFDRAARTGPRKESPFLPARPPGDIAPLSSPAHRPEGSLERNRLRDLVDAASPPRETEKESRDPDIELTLVLCV